MKVKIRTTDFRLSLAVPVSMAGLVLRWMPDRVFADMREKAPGALPAPDYQGKHPDARGRMPGGFQSE